jgi:plasmid stabilization system protein ParE
MLHPRSPWRDGMGVRTDFDAQLDAIFEGLLADFGLPEDRAVRSRIETAIEAGADPGPELWPDTRRGRHQARITLRRLAQRRGREAVSAWRTAYDREPLDTDPAEDETVLHS